MTYNTNVRQQRRMTKQKRAIHSILLSTKTHPTVEWVYLEASKIMPDISLATVYRNLASLCQDGLAVEMQYTKLKTRFDGNPSPHYHFVCTDCGSVFDVEAKLNQLREAIEEIPQISVMGQIDSHRLEFYGICRNCLAEKENHYEKRINER